MSYRSTSALFRILIILLVGMLVPVEAVMAVENRNSSSHDIAILLINITDYLPDAALLHDQDLTAWDIFPGDTRSAQTGRSLFVSGHAWRYKSQDLFVSIVLVEYRTHRAAASFAEAQGEPVSGMPSDTYRTAVEDNTGSQVSYGGAVGRLSVFVGATSESSSLIEVDAITKDLFLTQRTVLPLFRDEARERTIANGRRFGYIWGAASGAVMVVCLTIGASIGLITDRGLREWISNSRTDQLSLDHQRDLTYEVRKVLRTGFAVILTRVALLGIVTTLALAWPGLSVWHGILVILAFLFIWQVMETWYRERSAVSEFARGRVAFTLGLAGGIGSAILLFSGVVLIASAVGDIVAGTNLAPSKMFLLLAVLTGLEVMNWSRHPIRLTKRLLQPTVRRQIDSDRRAPILLLRSFQDDALEVRPPFEFAGAIDTFAGESLVRFEEVIAWSVWECGPLRAIGQPGTRLQPLGAVRDYFDSDSWRDAVNEIAEEAQAFVLIVGRSPSLIWEIENIRTQRMLAKTVFVFAPVDAEETARRVDVLCTTLELNPSVLGVGDFRQVLLLGFDDQGNPQVYLAAGRTADAYVIALREMLGSISPGAQVSGPTGWSRLESLEPATDLAKFDGSTPRSRKTVISWITDVLGCFVRV